MGGVAGREAGDGPDTCQISSADLPSRCTSCYGPDKGRCVRAGKRLKISVVTAVYNRESTIAEAVRSVQAQSHDDVEHVVQDGGSTDGTLGLLHQLARAGTELESAPDAGLYHAINRGIARASGDVVGVMHSDDTFAADDILETVARTFANAGIDGVYGDLEYVSASDTSRVIRYWRSGGYEPRRLRRGWMPPHPTLYLRRDVFDRWGAYDTEFRISADYDAILRWLMRGDIRLAYVPRVFVKMRVGGASNASLGRILRKSGEDYRALRRNGVGGIGTLALKNLSKVGQFIRRDGVSR